MRYFNNLQCVDEITHILNEHKGGLKGFDFV